MLADLMFCYKLRIFLVVMFLGLPACGGGNGNTTPVNAAPVLTSSNTANTAENTTAVITVTATDADADTLSFSLSGGADQSVFTIVDTSGVLSFVSAPDFESPADSNSDNVYEVQVSVSDGSTSVPQNLTVTVTDVNDTVTVPAAPTGLVATPGDKLVLLEWNVVPTASIYNLYWSVSSGAGLDGKKISNVSVPYFDIGLTNDLASYYVVTAENSFGQSIISSEVMVTPTAAGSASNILRVFVTSLTGGIDLSTWADSAGQTGLAAADEICTAHAARAGLSGTYIAWASDSNDDAYCRIHGLSGKKAALCGQMTLPATAGPWLRMDYYPYADTIDKMLFPNDNVFSPPRYTESGLFTASTFITNTSSSGEENFSTACGDWTSSVTTGGSAISGSKAYQLSHATTVNVDCDQTNVSLICMQTGSGNPLPNFKPTNKVIFTTSTAGSGDLTAWSDAGSSTRAAAGDAICQAHAGRAGLANSANFKAWLSQTNGLVSASNRITSDGPWVRADGVKVADSKADLIDGSLATSLNIDENGVMITTDINVWTGTSDTGMMMADTCSDWNSAFANGVYGNVKSAGQWWSSFVGSSSCSSNRRLYCLED